MSHFNRMPCRSSLAKQSNLNVSLQTWTDQTWINTLLWLFSCFQLIPPVDCCVYEIMMHRSIHLCTTLHNSTDFSEPCTQWSLIVFLPKSCSRSSSRLCRSFYGNFLVFTRITSLVKPDLCVPCMTVCKFSLFFIIADQSQQNTYTKQYHVMSHEAMSSGHHWCSRYAIEAKVENISHSLSWGFNVFLCFIWHNISIY